MANTQEEALTELQSNLSSLLAALNLISILISTQPVNWKQVSILLWEADDIWKNFFKSAWNYDRFDVYYNG